MDWTEVWNLDLNQGAKFQITAEAWNNGVAKAWTPRVLLKRHTEYGYGWIAQPGVNSVSTTHAKVMVELPVSGVVLKAGGVYRINAGFLPGGFNGSSYSIGEDTSLQINGFFYSDPLDPGMAMNVNPIDHTGPNPPNASGADNFPHTYNGYVYVGPENTVLGWVSYTSIDRSKTNVAVQIISAVPVWIDIYEVAVEQSGTNKIIAAVEATGERVIQSIDMNTDRIIANATDNANRQIDAINNMADRIDPQGIPGLRDLEPEEPETLPPIPTIPGPDAVLGADGVAALQEFWAAMSESKFFKLLMTMVGVSIGIGVITYLARRKKEE